MRKSSRTLPRQTYAVRHWLCQWSGKSAMHWQSLWHPRANRRGVVLVVVLVVILLIAGLQFDVHRRVEIVAGT